MLKITCRDIEALLKAIVLWEKIKPGQVAKRRVFRKYGILGTSKDRVFTAVIYGIARRQGIIDKIIAKHYRNPSEINKWLRAALRAFIYEHYFGLGDSNLKEALICFTPMVLEKRVGKELADEYSKIVDKVQKQEYVPANELEYLEYKYNVPIWLINKLENILPYNELIAFLEHINKPPPLSFRVNTLKTTVDEVLRELREQGFRPWISPYVPTVIKLRRPGKSTFLKLISEGKIIPQDDSSALASLILNPQPGELVVDLCAAPGGKTTHLAEIMKNKGKIIAMDLYRDRIQRMKRIIERMGINIVEIIEMDARYAVNVLGEEIADKVLLDPPCSSTGVLAKHPEARWRWNEESLRRLVKLQRGLLEVATRLVKPGGRILYTTCSILPEECEEQVKYILNKYKGRLKIIELNKPFSPGLLKGTMRAWPHKHGTTGFFYVLLEKT